MKIYAKLFFLLILIFNCEITFSQVTLPHHDPFNYTVGGGLQTQLNWTSLNSGDDLLITSANLSYPGFAAPTGNKIAFDGAGIDATKLFTQQTSGTVYYSFLLNIKNLGPLNTTGGYFIGFTEGASNSYGSTIWLKKFGGGYSIGINARTTEANTIWSTDPLIINKTYLVVASYQIVSGTTNDIVKLWLNPSSSGFSGTEPTATLTAINTGIDLANLNRILIRQDAANTTPFIELDELRIGTTWVSVTPVLGSSPLITIDPTGLNNFTYALGSGPSELQNYNLSGINLNGSDVTVTAPTDYEVSSDGGPTWNNSLTFSGYGTTINQTISVRLKDSLVTGNYNNEIISNLGGGASTINFNCNGTVTLLPTGQFGEENFNYIALTNLENYGWLVTGAQQTNKCVVASTGLSFTSYPSSNIGLSAEIIGASSYDEISHSFNQQFIGSVFYSFLVKVNSNGGEGYFTGLQSSAGFPFFNLRVFCRTTSGSSIFGLGIGSLGSYSATPIEVLIGTTVLLVVKYTIGGTARLYVINSVIPTNEPAIPEVEISAIPSFNPGAVFLRQDISSITGQIDGIRVASNWSNSPLPVELVSFSASVVGNAVKLNWKTETEVNNYGFEVERNTPLYPLSRGEAADGTSTSLSVTGWEKIGFVNGNGNSNSPKSYSYEDKNVAAGKYSYRLKQIDNDGKFEYSKIIEVDLGAPTKFELAQNFPNPFNPETAISFTLPAAGNVRLTIYNLLGQEVKSLVNEYKEAGTHIINFNASDFNSGVYIYKLEANGITQTRKMTLIK